MKPTLIIACSFALVLVLAGALRGQNKPADGMEELKLKLPAPQFKETPPDAPKGVKLEPNRNGIPRPAWYVPRGCANLALKKPVTSSDKDPQEGSLDLITDGDKEGFDGRYVTLHSGAQWVQIDLEKEAKLHAIVIWHNHAQAKIYHAVIVQTSNDPDFITDVTTLFNNDAENRAGLGAGTDLCYWETYEGKIVDAKGVKARYVRLYSDGNVTDGANHYTEVECWGLP